MQYQFPKIPKIKGKKAWVAWPMFYLCMVDWQHTHAHLPGQQSPYSITCAFFLISSNQQSSKPALILQYPSTLPRKQLSSHTTVTSHQHERLILLPSFLPPPQQAHLYLTPHQAKSYTFSAGTMCSQRACTTKGRDFQRVVTGPCILSAQGTTF